MHLFRSVSIALTMSGLVLGQNLDWENYDPPSTLVVPENPIVRAKFPFIDVHSHQWRIGPSDLADRVVEMDAMNMGRPAGSLFKEALVTLVSASGLFIHSSLSKEHCFSMCVIR